MINPATRIDTYNLKDKIEKATLYKILNNKKGYIR